MKKNACLTLIFTLAFLMTMTGCLSNTKVTDNTTPQITSVAATTSFEPTETAVVSTTTPTPATLEAVVMLPVPATYESLFDGTKLYSDGSRTVILKTIVKGEQVIITGTAGQYGVTAEGAYINLHLMSVVVTITPPPTETTKAPTQATTTAASTTPTTKATEPQTVITQGFDSDGHPIPGPRAGTWTETLEDGTVITGWYDVWGIYWNWDNTFKQGLVW